jgi:hypothetical protein
MMYVHFRFIVNPRNGHVAQHADIRVDRLGVTPRTISASIDGAEHILATRETLEGAPRWMIQDPGSAHFEDAYAYFLVDDQPVMIDG